MAITVGSTSRYILDSANFDHNGVWSMTRWVYPTLAATQSLFACKNNANTSDVQGITYVDVATNGAITCITRDDAGTTIQTVTSATGVLVANTWQHLALVRSSDTSLVVYVNSSSVLTNTGNISARSVNAARIVLGRNGSDANTFQGAHGYTKLWAGTALTTGEITTESEYRNAQVTTNLYANWKFQTDASATTDSSSNGRTLTLVGAAVTDAADPAGLLGDDPGAAAIVRPRFYMPSAWWTQAEENIIQPSIIQGVSYVETSGGTPSTQVNTKKFWWFFRRRR